MKKHIIRTLEALAATMPDITHKTKVNKKGKELKQRFPELKTDDGKDLEDDVIYKCAIDEPIDKVRLLKGVYAKAQGDKMRVVVEAVKAAKATQTDKIKHTTVAGEHITSVELAPKIEDE